MFFKNKKFKNLKEKANPFKEPFAVFQQNATRIKIMLNKGLPLEENIFCFKYSYLGTPYEYVSYSYAVEGMILYSPSNQILMKVFDTYQLLSFLEELKTGKYANF